MNWPFLCVLEGINLATFGFLVWTIVILNRRLTEMTAIAEKAQKIGEKAIQQTFRTLKENGETIRGVTNGRN